MKTPPEAYEPRDFTASAYQALVAGGGPATATYPPALPFAPTWPHLDEVYVAKIEGWLRQVSYKPGWRIKLRLDQFPMTGFLQISILAMVPDSYHPDDKIEVGSVAVLPPNLCDVDEFARWLGYILREREIHECREWLKVDGKVFDNPHTIDGWKGGS